MRYSDKSYNLRIELDTKNCELSEAEIAKFERGLDPLRDPVRKFPVCDLYVTITFHPPSNDYKIKTALVLTKRTLMTGDHDLQPYPAFERCVRKLIKKVEAYKQSLGDEDEIAKHVKGTHHEVVPEQAVDVERVQAAVSEGDYGTFRHELYSYEEPLRKRIGRWIERYPDVVAGLGEQLKIDDVVEEVFLNAFERFEERPREVRFGGWLEQLIDPSIKVLVSNPDVELENINFVRTLHGR